jgi:hypothetical protein
MTIPCSALFTYGYLLEWRKSLPGEAKPHFTQFEGVTSILNANKLTVRLEAVMHYAYRVSGKLPLS